jgi:hypothetical protein
MDLVRTVVRDAAGVFLWARLVVKSVIMATRRSTDVKYLTKQLREIPKDLNGLYKQLLGSISPADRRTAFKMFLLVARQEERLNAIALTWLDDLEDETFPVSYAIRPYTDDELKRRLSTAEILVDEVTKGLLEVSYYPAGPEGQFDIACVNFFHRTVLEFLNSSEPLLLDEFRSFPSDELQFRIALAEIWFCKPELVPWAILNPPRKLSPGCEGQLARQDPKGVARPIFILDQAWKLSAESRIPLLESLERVIAHHTSNSAEDVALWEVGLGSHMLQPHDFPPWVNFTLKTGKVSVFHWVAWNFADAGYARHTLSTKPELLHAKDDLSFLVSTSLSMRTGASLLKTALELGASPNELVKVLYQPVDPRTQTYCNSDVATPWMLFCTRLAALVVAHNGLEQGNGNCVDDSKQRVNASEKLEAFLRTGAVDLNCLVLVSVGREFSLLSPSESMAMGSPTHCVQFRQLVAQMELPNHETLLELMDGPKRGIWETIRGLWENSRATPSQRDLESEQASYLPFCLGMEPPPGEHEPRRGDEQGKRQFYVHSLKWADTQLIAKDFLVRVC